MARLIIIREENGTFHDSITGRRWRKVYMSHGRQAEDYACSKCEETPKRFCWVDVEDGPGAVADQLCKGCVGFIDKGDLLRHRAYRAARNHERYVSQRYDKLKDLWQTVTSTLNEIEREYDDIAALDDTEGEFEQTQQIVGAMQSDFMDAMLDELQDARDQLREGARLAFNEKGRDTSTRIGNREES